MIEREKFSSREIPLLFWVQKSIESARECERDVLGLKTAAYACYLTGGKAVISLFNS